MTYFPQQTGPRSPTAERLDEIRMTESERRHAMEYLQQGERFAEFVLARMRDARQLSVMARRGIAAPVRSLKALFARARRGRAAPRVGAVRGRPSRRSVIPDN
jgi:hypothetical protein